MTEQQQQVGPIDLDTAIANRLRQLREAAGVPREILALRGRYWGLDWNVGTVALIEDGRRRLTLSEFLLLPSVLNDLILKPDGLEEEGRRRFTLDEMLPTSIESNEVAVVPSLVVKAYALRALVRANGDMEGLYQMFPAPGSQVLQLYDEVSERAAKTLKVPVEILLTAVHRLWKRPLWQERDARMNAVLRASGEGAPSARRIQALRGHALRTLLAELRDDLRQTKSKPTSQVKPKGGQQRRKLINR